MSKMHHNKRHKDMPWCGMVRFPGRPEFMLGTVYTPDHDPQLARQLLTELAATIFPPGFTIGHIERGALVYRKWRDEQEPGS